LATFRRAGSESDAQFKIAQLFPQGPPANSAAPALAAQEAREPTLGPSMTIQELMEQERQKAIAARQYEQQRMPAVNPHIPWPSSHNTESPPQPAPEVLASVAPQPGAFLPSSPSVSGSREHAPPTAFPNDFESQRQLPPNLPMNPNQPSRQPSDLEQFRLAKVPDGQLNSVFGEIDRQSHGGVQPSAGAFPDYRQSPPSGAPTLQPWPGNPNLSQAPSLEGQWPQPNAPTANPFYPTEGTRPAGAQIPAGVEPYAQRSGGVAAGQTSNNQWQQPMPPSGTYPVGQQPPSPLGMIDEPTRNAALLGMSAGPGSMFSMPPNTRSSPSPNTAPPYPAPQQTLPGADLRINGAQFPAPLNYSPGQQFAEQTAPYGSQPPTAFRRSRPNGDDAYWQQSQPPMGSGPVPSSSLESSRAPSQPSGPPQYWGAPAQPAAPAWGSHPASAPNAGEVDMLAEYEQQIRRHNEELNALKQTLEAQRQAPAQQTSWAAGNAQQAPYLPPGGAVGSSPGAPNQFAPPNSFAAPMGTTPQRQW
jgi:hypothetical protein